MRSLILRATVFALAFIFAANLRAGWAQAELTQKIKVSAPKTGIQKLDLAKADGADIFSLVANYKGAPLPGEQSIVLEIDPPEASRVFYSFITPHDLHWTWPEWTGSLAKVNPLTQFALWQESSGRWGVLIALSGGGMNTTFEGSSGKLLAIAESKADKFAPTRVPMLVIGWGDDPYRLINQAYAFGLKTMKSADPDGIVGNLRADKKFPEIFRYLGWCSWNTYYQRVDEAKLIESAKSFRKNAVPVRWMIIDDRWMAITKKDPVHDASRKGSLTSFEADREKFPKGLAPALKALKVDYGITWVGVWITFQGYWNGIALDSEIGRNYKDALMPVSDSVGIPDPRSNAGEKFWEGWFGFLRNAGVDLIKVDNQSDLAGYVHGAIPSSLAMAQAQKNITGPTEKYFNNNLIDCMGMNVDTIYQWQKTNIGRDSNDYSPPSYTNPRTHQVKSVMNALWMSNLVWPDYDEWMTHDNYSEYYAVARAISGGPVYITDKPGQTQLEKIRPLVLSNGEVVRVDSPGLPCRSSILENPAFSGKPLLAFARAGDSGVLAAWNVSKKRKPVKTELSPNDVEGVKGEKFAVYDYFSGKLSVVSREQKFPVSLESWDVKIYSVTPIVDGFAPIGLIQKYIAPATIREIKRSPGSVKITLAEFGNFGAYCEQKPKTVKLNGSPLSDEFIEFKDGLLLVKPVALIDGMPTMTLELVW